MQKKQLKDLNLLDNFLFFTMTNHPIYGERFSRLLLKTIFNREFGTLKVVPQKTYYGNSCQTRCGGVIRIYEDF